jgi:hypothetical protein
MKVIGEVNGENGYPDLGCKNQELGTTMESVDEVAG